jgi:hypothetical protein
VLIEETELRLLCDDLLLDSLEGELTLDAELTELGLLGLDLELDSDDRLLIELTLLALDLLLELDDELEDALLWELFDDEDELLLLDAELTLLTLDLDELSEETLDWELGELTELWDEPTIVAGLKAAINDAQYVNSVLFWVSCQDPAWEPEPIL